MEMDDHKRRRRRNRTRRQIMARVVSGVTVAVATTATMVTAGLTTANGEGRNTRKKSEARYRMQQRSAWSDPYPEEVF